MSGEVVRLNRSLYGFKQAPRSWYRHLIIHIKSLSFKQRLVNAQQYILRLAEDGELPISAIVRVDDIFAVSLKSRCDGLCEDLNRSFPFIRCFLRQLRWYKRRVPLF